MERRRQHSPQLTERQRQVLRLIGHGHTNLEIAERLGITLGGAKWHVSELLNKFGADTREELAQRWEAEQRPSERLRRWLGGTVSLAPLKFSAPAAIAGVAAVTGSIAIAGAAMVLQQRAVSSGGDELAARRLALLVLGRNELAARRLDLLVLGPTHPPEGILTTVPAVALPHPPNAIWTGQDALARAEAWAARDLKDLEYVNEFASNAHVALTEAHWLPAVSHHELPDGDHYWDSQAAINAWYFVFEANDVSVRTSSGVEIQDFTFNVLLEDGVERPVATLYTAQSQDGKIGRQGGGFRSRTSEARDAEFSQPSGNAVLVAWLNGIVGGDSLVAYPTQSGTWCFRFETLRGPTGGMCGLMPAAPTPPVKFGTLTTIDSTRLVIQTSNDVVRLEVLPGTGATLRFGMAPAPASIPEGSRYAYLEVLATESVVIVGYDAAGNEVARASAGARGTQGPFQVIGTTVAPE